MSIRTRSLIEARSRMVRLAGLLLLSLLVMANSATAQLPIPASTQFDITGFIQEATLDPTCTADAHCGGTIKVNGHVVVVPRETIVILPANALTWQEIFVQAPAPYGVGTVPPSTGLALADLPAPLTTYEAQIIGNRVISGGTDRYIAGLIYISQHALNSGNGFINFIDYNLGEMRVGGTLGDNTTGTRVRINDPVGRFGRVMSPDVRFTVDADNPTIASATGFPMCLPRVNPALAADALCLQSQRPAAVPPAVGFSTNIQMNDPVNLPGVPPDATIQVPFEVGDWVTFAGTLVQDGLTPTAGPWPGIANTYISAHTISNNIAVYTWPGTNPAYVATEVTIIGTGGLTVVGAGEAVIRTRFEGMTTDVDPTGLNQRKIHLYGIDLNPLTGATSDRDWGNIGVDPGPPNGAVKGRWRFRPPCLPFGSVPAKPDKDCVMNAAGSFLPPTREVRAVIEGAWTPAGPQTTYANGIIAGQYHAPILEYIFPENVPGAPIVENNFNSIPFLAQGGYTSSAGTLVGQLNPWPSNIVPAPACAPPVANAGGPYVVSSGGTVGLSGSSGGTGPFTFFWTVAAGTLSDATLAAPNYTAPQVAAQTVVNASLTATNSCGVSTANATVTVNPALAPVVNPIAPQAVDSGSSGTFAVTASDSNVPASVPLTWSVTQTGTPTLLGLAISPTGPGAAAVTYTAPSGVLTVSVVTVTVTATNAAGVLSAPVSIDVTINPAGVVCVAPVANAGGPYSVNSGASVTLAGSSTGTAPITFSWASPIAGTIAPLSSASATYTAPVVAAQTVVNVSLTATNSCGSSTAGSTVIVNAALAPTVNPVAPISVFSGAAGNFTVSGADPNIPALTPLTFTVTQAPAGTLLNFTVTQNPPTGATVSFTAPTLPIGQVVPTVVQLTITDRNTAPLTSASVTTSVTVNPLPDVITVTAAEYRTGKQRLILTATSSVNSPNVVLKLQPYLTTTGTVYNPDPAAGGVGNVFTLAAGVYTLDVVGAPEPAVPPARPMDVKSNLNGDSGAFGLTRIRQ
ncbi:MAG: hypothetical protein LAP21_14365 [Acidobacteriia bacterium]|nr:hypothetical protein [Terriglobia bacterium]